MALLVEHPGLLEALRGEMTPKFLATRSKAGIPNVVPCISILPTEDQPDTLFFGNFLLRKSIKNLEEDQRVGVLVVTEDLQGWILKGELQEFQRTGPYVDRQMNTPLLRYNAYTGVRNVGLIRIDKVESTFTIPKLQVLGDYMMARLAGLAGKGAARDAVTVPLEVRKNFSKLAAVKVLAWVGADGYPHLCPALSMQAAGTQHFVCTRNRKLPEPPSGELVAANLLTFEAISYQAKGRWDCSGKTGLLQVQEIYSGGPPYPGGRVA